MKNVIDVPKVFISYSWSGVEHENRVVDLAEKLMSNGVNVILDKWDLKAGHDKYAFMEKMVTDPEVKKVLIICDKRYQEKADTRKGGVGTESQIISQEVYEKVNQEKFIPIIFEQDKDGRAYLPAYLKNRISISLVDGPNYYDEYEKLLRNIFGKPFLKKPPLGQPPSFLFNEEAPKVKTTHLLNSFKAAVLSEKKYYNTILEEYFNNYLDVLEEFRIDYSKTTDPDDEKIYNSINDFILYRNDFVELVSFISTHTEDVKVLESIYVFWEKAISFFFPPQTLNGYKEYWFDNYKFILQELYLYLITILIKNNRFDAVNFFLDDLYTYKSNVNTSHSPFMIFNNYIRSLDKLRMERLHLNRYSVVADILKERANIPKILFNDIVQTDFILTLRSVFYFPKLRRWHPNTLVYASEGSQFDLFNKGKTHRGFEKLKKLLKVVSKDDLINRYSLAVKNSKLSEWFIDSSFTSFTDLVDFEELDTL